MKSGRSVHCFVGAAVGDNGDGAGIDAVSAGISSIATQHSSSSSGDLNKAKFPNKLSLLNPMTYPPSTLILNAATFAASAMTEIGETTPTASLSEMNESASPPPLPLLSHAPRYTERSLTFDTMHMSGFA